MPETFDFTVRATAASGAFADRAFSITVTNTLVHRLVATGATGAARALTAGAPWTPIPGVKGESAAYGDRWLIWDQADGVLWRSGDAIDWVSLVPALPPYYTELRFLRWRDDAWWAIAAADRSLHWEISVVTSTDGGASWSLVGDTVADAGAATPGVSFERSAAGASIVATDTEWHFRSDDASPWQVARTFTALGRRVQIAHLNGVWFGPASLAASPGLTRSLTGAAWFDQTDPSPLTSGYYVGIAWGNGRAVAAALYDALVGVTSDAGLTVPGAGTLPYAPVAYDTECPIVCQQGTFVMLGDGGRTFHAADPAGTWQAIDLPPALIGQPTLAVRP